MCYQRAGQRPTIEKQEGNTEYVVHSKYLKVSRDTLHNITVIAYGAFSSQHQASFLKIQYLLD